MPKTPGLARAAVETEAVAAWGFVRRANFHRAGPNRSRCEPAAAICPAFCFAVIVFFSLEYKTLGLAGEPLVAAGVNPLVPFYINPLVHAGSLGQALIFCFFWIKPKEETFLGYS